MGSAPTRTGALSFRRASGANCAVCAQDETSLSQRVEAGVGMSSLVWLGLAVIFVVGVVLTGLSPKGGKPVARTRLMRTARGLLVGGVVAFGAVGLWGVLRR